MTRAPLLVFGVGNPGRGDDAVGALFVAELERRAAALPHWPAIEFITDMQMQVEHALDLQDRALVLIADADASLAAPCALRRVEARRDASYTSHVLSPAALLHACMQVLGLPAPPCFVLALRAQDFELGAPPGAAAAHGLAAGLELAERLLAQPTLPAWEACCAGRNEARDRAPA